MRVHSWNTLIEKLRNQEYEATHDISAIAVDEKTQLFVEDLAEYFRPSEIVLILRAAKVNGVIQ